MVIATTILGIIWEALKLAAAFFSVAIEDKKKAEEENRDFVIDQAKRKELADAAIMKLAAMAKKDTADAGSAWDKQDKDHNG